SSPTRASAIPSSTSCSQRSPPPPGTRAAPTPPPRRRRTWPSRHTSCRCSRSPRSSDTPTRCRASPPSPWAGPASTTPGSRAEAPDAPRPAPHRRRRAGPLPRLRRRVRDADCAAGGRGDGPLRQPRPGAVGRRARGDPRRLRRRPARARAVPGHRGLVPARRRRLLRADRGLGLRTARRGAALHPGPGLPRTAGRGVPRRGDRLHRHPRRPAPPGRHPRPARRPAGPAPADGLAAGVLDRDRAAAGVLLPAGTGAGAEREPAAGADPAGAHARDPDRGPAGPGAYPLDRRGLLPALRRRHPRPRRLGLVAADTQRRPQCGAALSDHGRAAVRRAGGRRGGHRDRVRPDGSGPADRAGGRRPRHPGADGGGGALGRGVRGDQPRRGPALPGAGRPAAHHGPRSGRARRGGRPMSIPTLAGDARPRTGARAVRTRRPALRPALRPTVVLSALVLLLAFAWALAPSLFTGFSPTASTTEALQSPSAAHWFGTDATG